MSDHRQSPRFLATRPADLPPSGLDVLLVTGDAYVDHPSFGVAVIGRWLQAHGFSVGIVAQPSWKHPGDMARLGRPRLFAGITAGNVDSMVNARTSMGLVRNDDPYTPHGRAGARPPRASIAYTTRVRQAFPGLPVVLGGIEASLRRFAHYDFWQDRIRRSILLDSKADLLVFGMGELAVLEIARRLAAGRTIRGCHDIPGTACILGPRDPLPRPHALELPSFQDCASHPLSLNRATRMIYRESSPHVGRPLLQNHGQRRLFCNPPSPVLPTLTLDEIHQLPYAYLPHPDYGQASIPAFEAVKGSITATRGCAGGCSFCSIALHQGRSIVSRSHESIKREIRNMRRSPSWNGIITDLGGPTANLYGAVCSLDASRRVNPCRRGSCLHPRQCRHFRAGQQPFLDLLRMASGEPGVRRVHVGSGLRHELLLDQPALLDQLVAWHVSGRLTVAPEHADSRVLQAMRKPPIEAFTTFARLFQLSCKRRRKRHELLPYFLSAHPGTTAQAAVKLAQYLKQRSIQPRQAQLFLPTPGTMATAMYVSGVDPVSGQTLEVPKGRKERARHRAMMYYWKRQEFPAVREALLAWGRPDLVGRGPGHLVPPGPSRGGWLPRPQERTG